MTRLPAKPTDRPEASCLLPTDGSQITALEFNSVSAAVPLDARTAATRPFTPLVLPGADAAALVGLSLSNFYRLKKTGRPPRPIRLERRVLWLRAELEAWMPTGAPSQGRWEAVKAGRAPRR